MIGGSEIMASLQGGTQAEEWGTQRVVCGEEGEQCVPPRPPRSAPGLAPAVEPTSEEEAQVRILSGWFSFPHGGSG